MRDNKKLHMLLKTKSKIVRKVRTNGLNDGAIKYGYVNCCDALGTLPDLFFFLALGTSFLYGFT